MSKDEVREYLASLGRKGGKSRSPKKLRALKKNLAKARAAIVEQARKGGAK
jgi:phage gp16-like protein